MKELKVIRFTVDDLDETTGIELVSVVENPANQSGFIKLSEQVERVTLASDKQKQYVTGLILEPEQLIYRRNEKTGEDYNITFGAEDIEKIRNKFFRTGNTKLSNLDHSSEDVIEGYLIESWIVEDPEKDKATALGLSGVKKGSFYATYHFPDAKVWAEVSKRSGFSLEGFFKETQAKLSQQTDPLDEIISELDSMLNEGL